jgi:hypothetical protein
MAAMLEVVRRRCRRPWGAWLGGLLALGCAEGTDAPLSPDEEETDPIVLHDAPPVDADTASEPVEPYPEPTPIEGRRRGFNLQGMYKAAWEENRVGYAEADFELLADLGFNAVRLPLDYLTYADWTDWFLFYEDALRRIDRGIELGQKHGIHVTLNIHGAPGYTAHGEAQQFIPPDQDLDLWSDSAAQDAFVAHWRMFARRYAEIPPEYLSFNLVNEPSRVDEATYLAVMLPAIDAIHEETPDREVILDGLDYGRELLATLDDPSIGQSIHVYDPFTVTHWGASWVAGSESWPAPEWPPTPLPQYLLGPSQGERQSALVIQGDFPAGSAVAIQVASVSALADLSVSADDTEILRERFVPDDDEAAWETVNFVEQYGVYQNVCDCERITAPLEQDASALTFEVLSGDWLSFSAIRILRGDEIIELAPGISDWGVPQATFSLDGAGRLEPTVIPEGYEAAFDWRSRYADWVALGDSGVHVTVGEFGVYSAVPEDVTAAFLEDHVGLFEEAGFDWTMWELAGDFGIFDGHRPGATYVPAGDRTVDQDVLEILQDH